MSTLSQVLAQTRAENRAALVAYLPVGFPTLERSLQAMRVVVEAGVDIVEVGLPYSDPLMDGPVIQHAAQVALANGLRVAHVFDAVRAVSEAGAACVTMSYWNPILRYGPERFASDLAAAGGSGIITPDLIPEEAGVWLSAATTHDLDPIFLVAPSSTDERLAATARHCRGFVYVASTMGVTGVRAQVGSGAAHLIERTRAVTDLPLCVGLGVSTREQAAQVASYADGVIVGSALVATLKDDEAQGDCADLRALTVELAAGVREGHG